MTPDQRKKLENVVKGLLEGDIILSPDFKNPLIDTVAKLEAFITKTSALDSTVSEADKETLYAEYKEYMKVLYESFKDTKYNFTLTEKEYKFLRKQICNKLKYNRQDNVIAIKVKDNFFKVADENVQAFKTTVLETFQTSIDDLTLISHLNAKIELEGVHEDNYAFASITEKIGAISRVYEYFDMKGEEISETVQNWFSGLEPEAKVVAELQAKAEAELNSELNSPTVE